MDKHLIVVSVDAMVYEDLEYCKTLPNFSKILKDASVIERVCTIYPSLTHPVHATLITGKTAGGTGIVNNIAFVIFFIKRLKSFGFWITLSNPYVYNFKMFSFDGLFV